MITIALVLLWQWPFSVMSSYIGLNGSRVARFSIASTGLPQTDSVQFILIDKDGNQTDTINCYVTPGEKLTLEGDVLSFAPWLNIFGLHSGYKPTALKGCALDPKHKDIHTVFILNDGGDGFFSWLQEQKWLSFLAEAHYEKSSFLQVTLTAKNYTVYTSQQGLYVEASN